MLAITTSLLFLVANVVILPGDNDLPPDDVVEMFVAAKFELPVRADSDMPFEYRLFKPTKLTPGRKYPLIVWLHGNGDEEFLVRNLSQLQHLGLIISSKEGALGAEWFVLVPHCPDDQRRFFAAAGAESNLAPGRPEPGDIVVKIIEALQRRESIDPERIVLVGISAGGTAAFEMAIRRPDLFAAVAPLASRGGDVNRISQLKDVPVWAFHSRGDPSTPSDEVRRTIISLERNGGICALTLTPNDMHDCWTIAFGDYGLLDWLLSQRRGKKDLHLPGQIPLKTRMRRLMRSFGGANEVLLFAVLVCTLLLYVSNRAIGRCRQRRAAASGDGF